MSSEIIESLVHRKRFKKRLEIRIALGERVETLVSLYKELINREVERSLSPPNAIHC